MIDTNIFICRVCGANTDIAPDPPARAICEGCCEDHDYRYDSMLGGRFCFHCGKQALSDWCEL